MLAAKKPDEPFFVFHPRILQSAAQLFAGQFLGDVVYDVHANASPEILRALYAGGIRQFAFSTLEELRTVKRLFPDVPCHFTHPVKSVTAIREAAHTFGVTHFTVDHPDELAKIIVHTMPLKPTIVVRLSVGAASFDPSGAFGCSPAEAAALMRAAAAEGFGVGLSFQCDSGNSDVETYRVALQRIGDTVRGARLQPELIDIGGGFPLGFADLATSLVADYCQEVRRGLSHVQLHHPVKLLCTPGRVLAAAGTSVVVKVELRRGNRLYLNDGVFGGLADLRRMHDEPHLRAWRINGSAQLLTSALDDFIFHGPGGDSFDTLPGPFALPGDIHMGDYVEIGGMGAGAQ